GGHSDLIAGVVVTKTEELGDKIKFIQNASGAILSPFDSWLLIRGIETLSLRVFKHAENALAIAGFLQKSESIQHLYYPGLASHNGHDIAASQMKAFGGVLSFDFAEDDKELALDFIQNLKL